MLVKVETNVIIADKSISPLKIIIQLFELEPPGEQPKNEEFIFKF